MSTNSPNCDQMTSPNNRIIRLIISITLRLLHILVLYSHRSTCLVFIEQRRAKPVYAYSIVHAVQNDWTNTNTPYFCIYSYIYVYKHLIADWCSIRAFRATRQRYKLDFLMRAIYRAPSVQIGPRYRIHSLLPIDTAQSHTSNRTQNN